MTYEELLSVTEEAALACQPWIGRGDRHNADLAATEAMRHAFDDLDGTFEVVIGEGERDEAPMLYIGEVLGASRNRFYYDVAVDPLEGTNFCARGTPGAICTAAVGPRGSLFHAPDTYMDKIAVGPAAALLVGGPISFSSTIGDNIRELANALDKSVHDVTVMVLDRPRNEYLVASIRAAGARVAFIDDGDVLGAIAPCFPETGIDALMGIGAAPEGVLAAAAIRALGGGFIGMLKPRSEAEAERCRRMGVSHLDHTYHASDLARGDVTWCATGVTDSFLMKGVRGDWRTSSWTLNSVVTSDGGLRRIETTRRQ